MEIHRWGKPDIHLLFLALRSCGIAKHSPHFPFEGAGNEHFCGPRNAAGSCRTVFVEY